MKRGVKLILIAAVISLACSTRVSEWVLINALPNQYTLVCFNNGSESETLKRQNQKIAERIGGANVMFKTVTRQDAITPYYGLYYEDRLFAKYQDPQQLQNLTSSPLRRKIAADLMMGKLCVMVYLKTGNLARDEKGLHTLRKTLELSPFGEIIAVAEIDRNSSEEAHFATLLLNVEDDLKGINEPMLFGVFGRFKALEPLLGSGISEENINLMISYLTAECSCLIKDDLPGTDILFTDSWENPQPALLNKIIDANPMLGE
jgi:hypothetical protein